MRKIIGIFFYVISGLFFYIVCVLAFASEPPGLIKLAVMGGFCLPALIPLAIGLACTRFQNWRRDTGIVITSTAGFTAFIILTAVCLFMDPGAKEFFPDNKLAFLSDYVSGFSFFVFFTIIGILLIRSSKGKVS